MAVAPRPADTRSNLLTIIEAGAVGGGAGALAHDIYLDLKVVGNAAVNRLRDRLSDPGDEEAEYVHQLVAEAFGGPCPPGHKLVHLNGIVTDNRWPENLAYVPGSDPRPAAPLKPHVISVTGAAVSLPERHSTGVRREAARKARRKSERAARRRHRRR